MGVANCDIGEGEGLGAVGVEEDDLEDVGVVEGVLKDVGVVEGDLGVGLVG